MTITEHSEYPLQQPSRFINTVAVVSIFVSGYQIYDAISNMMLMDSLSGTGTLSVGDDLIRSLSPSPAANYFEILLSMFIILASAAMFKRLEWGRKLYLWSLATTSLWTVISSIRTYSSVSQNLNLPGMAGTSAMLIFLMALMTIGINGYLVWKLTRDEIRGEFR